MNATEELRLEQLNAQHACAHGEMERRSGIGAKSHKAYAGFFCPEDVCPPDWADLSEIIGPALEAWARTQAPEPAS
jgi:hypothetical protein